jgi:hypothetical protein
MRGQYCINGNTCDDDSFALLLFARLLQYGSNVRSQVVMASLNARIRPNCEGVVV